MIGPGRHRVAVSAIWFAEPLSGKKEQLAIRFIDGAGDTITWYNPLGCLKDGSFSQKALDFACEQLEGIGWKAAERGYQFEELVTTPELIGRECEIIVAADLYDGKTRNKVKYINDPNGGRIRGDQMAPEAARTFADRIRFELMKTGTTIMPPVSAVSTTSFPLPGKTANEIPLDDIPF